MGVGVSSFPDNDSLIDSIVKRNDFPPHIERVLRLVDRGDYTISPKTQIYSDSAWRVERLHLSAPGIYATVLRDLNIQPGQSVLNIGSGTGYLSTMFGLLLGSNGVNHGIELHSSNVQFARERLRHFMSTSDAIYECDFCPPQFTVGNIFSVVPPSPSAAISQNSETSEESENILEQSMHDDPAQISQLSSPTIIDPPPPIHRNTTGTESDVQTWPTYDRIYVGAMISSINQLKAILRLLNVGGSLIAPIFDQLHKIDRVTETVLNDTVLNSVSFVNLVVPSSDEPEVLPLPKREVDRLEVLACRCLRRELRRVIIQRNGGQLPTLPRYVRRKRRRHRRPPLQPFTGSSPPSSPPGDNPPPSTSRATLVSPQGSTPIARSSNPSLSSTSPSSPRQHRLPTNSGLENGIGGGEYADTDELDGVRPFTSPNPPHRSSPPPPIRPPEAPQLLTGILSGDTIDVNIAGSSNTTASEQMDFIEMISRNFLYCRMLARNRQRYQDRLPELSDEDNQIADEGEQNDEEDTSYSNDSSTESSTGSYTSPCEDSDQTNSEEEEEDREEREDHAVADEEERDQGSDSPSRRQYVGHSSHRGRRNKRRRRGDTTEESTGHDSDNEHDSGTRKEVRRKVRSGQCRKKRHLVWRRQSYLFQEEMRRLLEEIRHAVDYSGYVGELVLKIN